MEATTESGRASTLGLANLDDARETHVTHVAPDTTGVGLDQEVDARTDGAGGASADGLD
jgi:hypothetical protein